jgi:hypothetical protein
MKRRISLAAALLLLGMAGADAAVTSPFLMSNQTLKCGDRVYSKNGLFFLAMQADGNLVFYRKDNKLNHPLFAARTDVAGVGACKNTAVMQTDGNLVVYHSNSSGGKKTALWSSGTVGHKGAFAYVQNDGNFIIYDGKNPLWASRSGGTGAVPSASIAAQPAVGSVQAIIEKAFQPLGSEMVAWALCIAQHESGFHPDECYENSQAEACGLFQFEPGTWAETPYARYSRFNPTASAEAAKWLYQRDGPWPWTTHIFCRSTKG